MFFVGHHLSPIIRENPSLPVQLIRCFVGSGLQTERVDDRLSDGSRFRHTVRYGRTPRGSAVLVQKTEQAAKWLEDETMVRINGRTEIWLNNNSPLDFCYQQRENRKEDHQTTPNPLFVVLNNDNGIDIDVA
jgi:hypothetical protein